MKRKDNYEDELMNQIPEATPQSQNEVLNSQETTKEEPVPGSAASYLGQKLTHNIGHQSKREEDNKFVEEHRLSRVGENIHKNAEIREGWIEVDRRLLQERDVFYPEDWRFFIKPADVQAIRNWSTIDDENPNSVDDVFNEILKACLSIKTNTGTLSWGNINSWDRFFFILLIHEYSMQNGETKIEFEDECPECGNPVTYKFDSLSLGYDFPDSEVMKYYDQETRTWYIDPEEFGISGEETIKLYLPTLDKDAALKAYAINKVRNKKKLDEPFFKFAEWMTQKISKDETIAEKQIKELQVKYNAFSTEMFAFVDSVIKNIMVTPDQTIKATCPSCGEESTARIRFQNGIRSLFDISNRFKKFGSK